MIDDINDETNEETKAWLTKHFEVDKQIDFNEFFIAVGPKPWLPWLSGSKKFGWGCPCGDGTFEMLKKLRPKWVNIIGQSANLHTDEDNDASHGQMKPKPSKGLIDISKISSHTSVTDKLRNFGVDYITATDEVQKKKNAQSSKPFSIRGQSGKGAECWPACCCPSSRRKSQRKSGVHRETRAARTEC